MKYSVNVSYTHATFSVAVYLPYTLYESQCFLLVVTVRLSFGIPASVTEVFRAYPFCLQVNAGMASCNIQQPPRH
jgi:hypothetical protein